jgi:hypothetical protein
MTSVQWNLDLAVAAFEWTPPLTLSYPEAMHIAVQFRITSVCSSFDIRILFCILLAHSFSVGEHKCQDVSYVKLSEANYMLASSDRASVHADADLLDTYSDRKIVTLQDRVNALHTTTWYHSDHNFYLGTDSFFPDATADNMRTAACFAKGASTFCFHRKSYKCDVMPYSDVKPP